MYTIGIDTSHQFLVLVVMDDKGVMDSLRLDCFKQQSEYIIPKLDELLNRNNLKPTDVTNLVLAKGPGSYTGVRIGMTVVKIWGAFLNLKVYTLSTLQLYAGLKDCHVVMDARASRVYAGRYNNGNPVKQDTIYTIDEMKELLVKDDVEVVGDAHLFDKQDNYQNIENNFFLLKDKWELVDNVCGLTPVYLKSTQEYQR